VPAQAEDRLSTWKEASLSHVHLVPILHFGRAEIDGAPIAYVVTEFAEEVLSQIIPERPLAPEEAREMLEPVLDALSYLHSKKYVHAHLRPSNILVVENEVKLAVDSIVTRESIALDLVSSDSHNAPETATNPVTTPADIWSLGITLVEVLSQQLPVWDSADDADPVLPELPKPFARIARECLRVDPSRRCTLSEIRSMLAGKTTPISPLVSRELPEREVPAYDSSKPPRARLPVIPLVVGLILFLAIIIGFSLHSRKADTAPLQTETTRQAPPADPASRPPAPSPAAAGSESAKGEVLHRVVPDVPERARNTIQGRVGVSVRVSVDPAGSVTDAVFTKQGPSAYFARLAMESAREWKFKPSQQNGQPISSSWLLRYEFKRNGTDVTPVETNP
jgi:TonB family protein